MEWYLAVWKKFAEMNGRARRKEYWMFALFNVIIYIAIALIASQIHFFAIFYVLYLLASLVPSFTVTVRRLHDSGHSAWWLLFALVPFIGGIVLFIFMLLDSEAGDNQYGPNPKLS